MATWPHPRPFASHCDASEALLPFAACPFSMVRAEGTRLAPPPSSSSPRLAAPVPAPRGAFAHPHLPSASGHRSALNAFRASRPSVALPLLPSGPRPPGAASPRAPAAPSSPRDGPPPPAAAPSPPAPLSDLNGQAKHARLPTTFLHLVRDGPQFSKSSTSACSQLCQRLSFTTPPSAPFPLVKKGASRSPNGADCLAHV